jgi:hypothetical protein
MVDKCQDLGPVPTTLFNCGALGNQSPSQISTLHLVFMKRAANVT